MSMIVFMMFVAMICAAIGVADIVVDLKIDNTPVEDWFWAYQVEQKFYLPTEMEGWPNDEDLEPEFVIVSEEGRIWSGKTLDLRDWEALKFELETGLAIQETTWVEDADADPADDGIVLFSKEKSFLPKFKSINPAFIPQIQATVQYEESDPTMVPMPMDPLVLKSLKENERYPLFQKNDTVSY